MIDQVRVPMADEMGPTFKGGGILQIKQITKINKTHRKAILLEK